MKLNLTEQQREIARWIVNLLEQKQIEETFVVTWSRDWGERRPLTIVASLAFAKGHSGVPAP